MQMKSLVPNPVLQYAPPGCTLHAKWCPVLLGRMQTGNLFVYAPYVYWKAGAYQNVTPDKITALIEHGWIWFFHVYWRIAARRVFV